MSEQIRRWLLSEGWSRAEASSKAEEIDMIVEAAGLTLCAAAPAGGTVPADPPAEMVTSKRSGCQCSCHTFGGSHVVACCGFAGPADPPEAQP